MNKDIYKKYEVVVGLEVHVQLSTQSKAFCADPTAFGSPPNTNVSPVSLGHPGTLPFANRKMIDYAVKMGLATNGQISSQNLFARKNYFYADLPKGYQITQDTQPICVGGYVCIRLKNGDQKKVRLHHIHMEDDAGKSIHDQEPNETLIDLNRAGMPLIEIVSEPDMRSGEEANLYFAEIRKLVRYLDICDGNMEEGSLRCDANISVRLKGEKEFGTRCEVKNMNSMRHVQKAVEYEAKRQIEVIEAGGRIEQNTLNYDPTTGKTSVLRVKETANDYRYFPEPDMPPLLLSDEYIAEIKQNLPVLPQQWFEKLVSVYGLPDYDANIICESKKMVTYFVATAAETDNYKAIANWLIGPVKSYLNEKNGKIEEFPLVPTKLADLIQLIDSGKINYSLAAQKLFPVLLASPSEKVEDLAQKIGIVIDTHNDALESLIDEVLIKNADKVQQYKKGKTGLLGMFMGEVMKLSQGKIDPKTANDLLKERLDG